MDEGRDFVRCIVPGACMLEGRSRGEMLEIAEATLATIVRQSRNGVRLMLREMLDVISQPSWVYEMERCMASPQCIVKAVSRLMVMRSRRCHAVHINREICQLFEWPLASRELRRQAGQWRNYVWSLAVLKERYQRRVLLWELKRAGILGDCDGADVAIMRKARGDLRRGGDPDGHEGQVVLELFFRVVSPEKDADILEGVEITGNTARVFEEALRTVADWPTELQRMQVLVEGIEERITLFQAWAKAAGARGLAGIAPPWDLLGGIVPETAE
jgi:hypothetical protein